MTPKELFIVILKILGIYLIKDVLISIPPVIYHLLGNVSADPGLALFTLITSISTLGIFVGIVYLLLFQSEYLVRKLNLTGQLGNEPLRMNLHRSSVYTIAIVVSGILILVFAIPVLVQEVYAWSVFLDLKRETYNNMEFNFSRMLTSAIEIIIGLLFLGNQKLIVNYIEVKRTKIRDTNQD